MCVYRIWTYRSTCIIMIVLTFPLVLHDIVPCSGKLNAGAREAATIAHVQNLTLGTSELDCVYQNVHK